MSGRTTPSTGGGPGSGGRRDSLTSTGSTSNTTPVKVVLRIRPPTQTETVPTRFQRVVVHRVNPTTLQLEQPVGGPKGAKSTFTFDHVIGPSEGQAAVYNTTGVDALVDSFIAGMNTTILAYGQTSSGKSYTMGTDRPDDAELVAGGGAELPDRLGITPRAVAAIFDRVREQTNPGTTFAAKLSYVEIYNEDLIDLLAGDADIRPQVQIREDKNGTIIWSGLRELKVNSAAEVMNALTAGSALRQTNATDMNAQSSRSHAIFSLTLTQKRYTGAGAPPSSGTVSPNPASRRVSGLPRITSPTPGSRSATPDRPGSRIGGLRPPSSLGTTASGRASPVPEDDRLDRWVTVTSKFHFVDLAGSERLKRTSAQGERVKEGISINSGLHALGNVISALGDPARARQTTHIPYRDSKLTRLLQDSLGGNAQTMMVACVSPTEFNLNETLSTVKYANRARNIKNRAEVNEIEVGWDDVEYLQRTITKLRAEMGGLRTGGEDGMGPIAEEGARGEMEDKYADLTAKVAQLKTELAAARAIGGEGGAGTSLSREDFAKAVEPIVEEYEKSLSALESQLSLTQAALKHSEEEMADLEARVEEEAKTNEASAVLIGDLRNRIGKLAEREATAEAYVRDLEAKLKDFGERDDDYGAAVSDLRKEITRNREQADMTEQYIKELEARLARSDEASATLRRHVEVLERDVVRREDAYRELESRLSLLDTSGDHKQLLAEIDERDKRLLDLERSVDDLKSQALSAEAEAQRLQKVASLEKEAKEELQSRVRTLERASLSVKARPASFTPPQTPAEGSSAGGDPLTLGEGSGSAFASGLEKRIVELEATHERILTELEITNVKYRDSLKEIEELKAQAQEAKILQSEESDNVPSPTSSSFNHTTQDDSDVETLATPATPSTASSRVLSIVTTPTSPRTTPRSRRSMPLASQHRLSFLGRGQGAPAHSHLRSASLSQELSLAPGLQFSSPPSPRPNSPSYRDSLIASRDMFSSPTSERTSERTYEQMKGEVMKLQETLSEREEEISALEATLHQLRAAGSVTVTSSTSEMRETPQIITSGEVTPPAGESPSISLSPKTRAAFDALKAELRLSPSEVGEPAEEDSAVRLDNLMRAMAKKESAHRETIEQLEDKLTAVKRQHDELVVLSRDQVVNMSSEIERLRATLEERPEASHYDGRLKQMQDNLDAAHSELEGSRAQAAHDLASAKASWLEEHQQAAVTIAAEHAAIVLQIKEEHASVLRRQTAESSEASLLRQLDHDSALQAKTEELENLHRRKADELDEQTRRFEIERAALASSEKNSFVASVDQLNAEHAAVLQRREEEFSIALEKLSQDHSAALSSRDASHAATLAKLREEHDASIIDTITGHSESLARLREEHDDHVVKLKDDHSAAIAQLHTAHSADMDAKVADHNTSLAALADSNKAAMESMVAALASEHAKAIQDLATRHESALTTLSTAHETKLAELSSAHEVIVGELHESHSSELASLRDEHATLAAADQERREAHAAVVATLDQHKRSLASLATFHEFDIASLRSEHTRTLEEQGKAHDTLLEDLKSAHTGELAALAARCDTALANHSELVTKHEALASQHAEIQSALALAQADQEGLLEQFAALHESSDATIAEHQAKIAALEVFAAAATSKASAYDLTVQELQEAMDALSTLDKALVESREDRDRLVALLQRVQATGDEDRVKIDALTKELSGLKVLLAKRDQDLLKIRAEKDTATAEVARLNAASSSPAPEADTASRERARSPTIEGTPSRLLNGHGLPNGKAPPPTPPPSMPPPPLPTSLPNIPQTPIGGRGARSSSSGSITTSMGASRSSNMVESPGTSVRPSSSGGESVVDPRVSKKLEEQEAAIARLTTQLTHCESDLHANIDLVNTLESALNDSERNLRKARQQMGDLARERDGFLSQNEALRREIQEKRTEAETMRNSVIQVESQYQEARRQKDEATRQLNSRLKEVQSHKSKFQCV